LSDEQLEDIAKAVKEFSIDGVLVTNTSNQRPKTLISKYSNETGGLSGSPIRELSTECIRKMYKFTEGDIFIIGIGGVGSGRDAYEKIRAGASVVQIYSRMAYEGPGVVSRIRKDLAEILRENGHSDVSEAVGLDHEDIYWDKKLGRAKKVLEDEKVIVEM
jgi:dihydroorotate dehydrogenase